MKKITGKQTKQTLIRLTDAGAEALSQWLGDSGTTYVELGAALGTHAVAARRLVTREGRLTLEQVAKLVALSNGELPAYKLVEPRYISRISAIRLEPERKPIEEMPEDEPTIPLDAEGAEVEDLARSTTPGNIAVLRRMRDTAKSQSLRVKCALALNDIANGRPGQRERQERAEYPVRDEELIEKFRRLIADAKARLAREHGKLA